jgi:site-specific DNA-methyltransferase (adenine-specific)
LKPYYENEHGKLYCGDCTEILMQLLRDGSVSFAACVTDPPYGLGDRMNGGTWGAKEKYDIMRTWDVKPSDAFMDMLAHFQESIIWGGNYFHLPPSRCWLVWDKKNGLHTMADCEMAWTNFDHPTKRYSSLNGVHDAGHPTQKPLSLMTWSLEFTTLETILDPFAGSGTTLVAAQSLGRRWLGIEISEQYCEIAKKRLEGTIRQIEGQVSLFETGGDRA